MEKYRVKETAINSDGTNVWFYPQALVFNSKSVGFWFWKKEIKTEEYHNYYDMDKFIYLKSPNDKSNYPFGKGEIVAFRTLENASFWLTEQVRKSREYGEKQNEKLYKNIGGVVTTETTKEHIIKID